MAVAELVLDTVGKILHLDGFTADIK